MGQNLHGSATTTEAIRRAIQNSQKSVRKHATRYGISPTTVQKWKYRSVTVDAKVGPREVRTYLPMLDKTAKSIQRKSVTRDAGTKHLIHVVIQGGKQ